MANLTVEFKGNGIIRIASKQYNFDCFSVPRNSISTSINGLDTNMLVYFLIDSFQGKREKRSLYVGQTSQGMRRFFDHKGKKEWWDKVILFTAKKSIFDSDTILGLENLLIEKFKKSGNYIMDQAGSASEIQDDCVFFGEQILNVMDFLGYGVTLEDSNDSTEPIELPKPIDPKKPVIDGNILFKMVDKAIKAVDSSITSEQAKLYTAYRSGKSNICAVWVGAKRIEIELYIELEKIRSAHTTVFDITNRARGNKKSAIRIYSEKDIETLIRIIQQIVSEF